MQNKLPLINSAHGSETRNIINELIKLFNGMGYTYDEALSKAHDVLEEAKRTNNMNKNVQKQVDDLILHAGESDAEVIQARGEFPLLKDRILNIEDSVDDVSINVKRYGMSTTATWQTNRDAMQAANDYVYSKGGGTVLVPPGEYLVKGIVQDSNVIFDLKGVTLKSPDGLGPSIISSREYSVTGSVGVASNIISVDSPDDIHVGSSIAIEGAGGMLNTQQTTLASNIDNSTTSFLLTDDDGNFQRGGFLRVGNELIRYSSISNKRVTVTERGALGTSARSHVSGSKIGLAIVFYTEVVKKTGNTLILKDSLPINVVNTICHIGAFKPGIVGGTFDGNKPNVPAASSVYGVHWSGTKFGKIDNSEFIKCGHGGVILTRGASDNTINSPIFRDIGQYDLASGNKGAGLWIFQGCKGNKVSNPTFTGGGWVAAYIDDRTTISNQFDAPNTDNFISNYTIDFNNTPVGYNPGMIVTGSSRNIITSGSIKGPYTGFTVERGSQYLGEQGVAKDNEFNSVSLDVRQPWNISSPGNRINNIVYSDRMIANPVTDESTVIYAISPSKGESAVFGDIAFQDGMPSKPSITFTNDRDTGIIRYGENTMGMVSNGELIVTLYNTLMRLKDGYTIETGTTHGTRIGNNANNKMGFYGKTPIAQQPKMDNTKGYTLEQLEYEVNAVKNVLRNLGLIGQ